MADFNGTLAVLRIGRLFLKSGRNGLYGLQIARRLRMSRSTTHSILHKLESDAIIEGKVVKCATFPPVAARRVYHLTDAGRDVLKGALSELQLAST